MTKQSSLSDADIETLVAAFKSDEFNKVKHLFVKIIEKQAPEQINAILKAIFKAHAFEDTKSLFKKLGNLFTLQKIEQAVHTEFGEFQGTQKAALQLSQTAHRNTSTKQTLENHLFKSTIKHYVLSTIDWFVDSVLFILQLKDVTDNDASRLEKQMVAQMRYQSFRENIAIIGSWLIALSLYTGNFVSTAVISAGVTITAVVSYLIYDKLFKSGPDKVHPGKNITTEASKGNIDPVFGRDEIVKKLFDTLEGNTKTRARRYPMVRGGTGMGKSDMGNAMALYLTSPDCPKEWQGKKLFVISTADIVTGGAHGKMEHLEHIKDELEGREHEAILFFTEAHVGFQEKTFFLGQEFKTLCDAPGGFPYMIFATTDKEYIEHVAKDTAFARRLDFFDIAPTKDEVTELIVSDMVTREAADMFVLKEAIKEVSTIRSQEIEIDGVKKKVFQDCPQPATSIAITSKVLANARHPWFKEQEQMLQDLKNSRNLLDHQLKLERGIHFLPYSEEGKKVQSNLGKLDKQIEELENELAGAKNELELFRTLVKKTSAIEEEIEALALEIKMAADKDKLSEDTLKYFILLLNYLKPAMDHSLQELNGRISHASAIIDKETMQQYVKLEAHSYLRKVQECEMAEKKAREKMERSQKFVELKKT